MCLLAGIYAVCKFYLHSYSRNLLMIYTFCILHMHYLILCRMHVFTTGILAVVAVCVLYIPYASNSCVCFLLQKC